MMDSAQSGAPAGTSLQPEWWQSVWLPVVILSLAVWLAFGGSVANELVFADRSAVLDDNALEDLAALRALISREDYFRLSDESVYRPVATLSYLLDRVIAGAKPWIYHLHNVVLHHANVLLVFALFVLLGLKQWRAFAVALVFAVHPLQAEAVIFPGFRGSLQMALGALVMSCCLAADRREPVAGWVLLAGALAFGIGLFAGGGVLLIPLAWLVYDALVDRRSQRRVAFGPRYVPLVIVAAAYIGVRFFLMAHPQTGGFEVPGDLPLSRRLGTAPYLFAYSVRQFLWPVPVSIIHEIEQPAGTAVRGALLVIAAVGAIWLILAWRERWLLLPGLWIIASFAAIPSIYTFTAEWAEHLTYVMNLGGAALAVGAVSAVWGWFVDRTDESRRPKLPLYGWVVFGLLAWAAAMYDVARVYTCRNAPALWRATLRAVPGNVDAMVHGALWAIEEGDLHRAEQLLRKAESREGVGIFQVHAPLGRLLCEQERWREAVKHLEKALDAPPPSSPEHLRAMRNLAEAYEATGRRERAIALLREAYEENPDDPQVREGLEQLGALPDDQPTTATAPGDPSTTATVPDDAPASPTLLDER